MAYHVPGQARRALSRACCAGHPCLSAHPPRQLPPRIKQIRSLSSASASTSRRPAPRPAPATFTSDGSNRAYVTSSPSVKLPRDIAVLGGGLTGLTTAFYLTRFHPDANITVYEKTDRLGGWIDTDTGRVRTLDGQPATVNFERGARGFASQRNKPAYDDLVLCDLIHQLKLDEEPLTYGVRGRRTDRYIYYPDHLVRLPHVYRSLRSISQEIWRFSEAIVKEPLYTGVLPAMYKMVFSRFDLTRQAARNAKAPNNHEIALGDAEDVSIGDFFQHYTGRREVVDNFVSAMVHGIYGGDVWNLSLYSSMFQSLAIRQRMHMRKASHVLIKVKDLAMGAHLINSSPNIEALAAAYNKNKVNSFLRSSILTDALTLALKKNPKVLIKTHSPASGVTYQESSEKVEVTSNGAKKQFDKVISTLFSGDLAKVTGNTLPSLKDSQAVTIQIVNLWYPKPNLNSPNNGTGYLVPATVPLKNNPHCALGVLFDSDRESTPVSMINRGEGRIPSIPGLVGKAPLMDTADPAGTKLTVMLGGHLWDELPRSSWPDAQEATKMALETVQMQLGIPANEPVYSSTKVCRDCIPQHRVGHFGRMADAHRELLSAFGGRLAVAGGSYTAQGVLPSIRAARDVAMQVTGQTHRYAAEGVGEMAFDMSHVGDTGLQGFVGPQEFAFVRREHLPLRYGNGASALQDTALKALDQSKGRLQ